MQITVSTQGHNDIIDITPQVQEVVQKSKVSKGAVLVFVPGSTAAITTIEYEPGVVEDLKRAISELVPEDREYQHDKKWGDGNGYAHVRAALMKPSLTIPIIDGQIQLGTWQQIVLLDFDNKTRERTVIIQVF